MAALPPRTNTQSHKHIWKPYHSRRHIIPWAEGKSDFLLSATSKLRNLRYLQTYLLQLGLSRAQHSRAQHYCTAEYCYTCSAQHSHRSSNVFFPRQGKTEIREFQSHVTSMRGRAGCQNTIRHLSPFLLLLKAETQGTTFFLSCDSHPHILLFSEWKLLAQKAEQ